MLTILRGSNTEDLLRYFWERKEKETLLRLKLTDRDCQFTVSIEKAI